MKLVFCLLLSCFVKSLSITDAQSVMVDHAPIFNSSGLNVRDVRRKETDVAPKQIQCSGHRTRKEVREMKLDGDFEAFVAAFTLLVNEGQLHAYDAIHKLDWNYKHMNPVFLIN